MHMRRTKYAESKGKNQAYMAQLALKLLHKRNKAKEQWVETLSLHRMAIYPRQLVDSATMCSCDVEHAMK